MCFLLRKSGNVFEKWWVLQSTRDSLFVLKCFSNAILNASLWRFSYICGLGLVFGPKPGIPGEVDCHHTDSGWGGSATSDRPASHTGTVQHGPLQHPAKTNLEQGPGQVCHETQGLKFAVGFYTGKKIAMHRSDQNPPGILVDRSIISANVDSPKKVSIVGH